MHILEFLSVLGSIMPPKNNSIPINPSKIYSMTHEEEELQYEISKLRYQVQQVSILRRAIEDEIDALKAEMEAKLDGLKDKIITNMDDKLVEDHIEHQQQVLQLSKDNLTLVQNKMKQPEDLYHIERSSEAVTETRTPQVQSISNYLSKWKNFPVEDSTWYDENFIQKH